MRWKFGIEIIKANKIIDKRIEGRRSAREYIYNHAVSFFLELFICHIMFLIAHNLRFVNVFIKENKRRDSADARR